MNNSISRRNWCKHTALVGAEMVVLTPRAYQRTAERSCRPPQSTEVVGHAERFDLTSWQALAQRAVDAARSAGATYADARLTRNVIMFFKIDEVPTTHLWTWDMVGVGVRVAVNGYWGFAGAPFVEQDAIINMARGAVAQAKVNAKGPPRTIDLGHIPAVTGTWTMPVQIDPFSISMEEKCDFFDLWLDQAAKNKIDIENDGSCVAVFTRRECTIATSEGSVFAQTTFASGGRMIATAQSGGIPLPVSGIGVSGQGWERFVDAKLPDQWPQLYERSKELGKVGRKPTTVGRYTIICDGSTMASIVTNTLGIGTQLDRALGYEADAGGTSFIDDPLSMVGNFPIAPSLVTLTANRSLPAGLATVRWDDEGVEPQPFTLIQNGVLTDFQTTREQAAWLAPYYQQHHRPVRSNGCAFTPDALCIPMQHMPNLSLEPSHTPVRLEDLIGDVRDGILIQDGMLSAVDFQARNGLISGQMRFIRDGKAAEWAEGGSFMINTQQFWKSLAALGGASTMVERGFDAWSPDGGGLEKGQPPQTASHTVRAVAAMIPNQPLIIPQNRA